LAARSARKQLFLPLSGKVWEAYYAEFLADPGGTIQAGAAPTTLAARQPGKKATGRQYPHVRPQDQTRSFHLGETIGGDILVYSRGGPKPDGPSARMEK